MKILLTDESTSRNVAHKLTASGEAAINMRPVMNEIAIDMMRVTKIVFASEGRRGGGSWAHLAPDTVTKRGNSGPILRTMGTAPGYGSGEDALYKSLTEPDAKYQILKISKDSILYGTSRPYAGVQQRGSARRGIHRRPFLRFLPTDVNRWHGAISRHILRPVR